MSLDLFLWGFFLVFGNREVKGFMDIYNNVNLKDM